MNVDELARVWAALALEPKVMEFPVSCAIAALAAKGFALAMAPELPLDVAFII